MSIPLAKDFAHIGRMLNTPNYRYYFSGQSVSLIGSWMTRTATWWLVWRLTGSTFMVGMIGFAGQIPAFLLGPFAGVWVDRWDSKRLLLVTQGLAMLQSFALAAVAFAPLENSAKIVLLLALAAFQGIVDAFDGSGRMVLVVDMVENPNDLSNAIALNSTIINLGRMIGPALAGAAVALVGEGWCFLADGFSYIAVLTSLILIRVSRRKVQRKPRSPWAEFRDGWQYIRQSVPIRSILLVLCLVNLAATPYQILLPAFADKILQSGAAIYGILVSAAALGALSSTMVLAARRSVVGLDKQIFLMVVLCGIGLGLLSVAHLLWLALPLLAVVGFSSVLSQISCNTFLQTIADDDKRGRVMGFYTLSQAGMAALGGLVIGGISNFAGVSVAFAICGACCLMGAQWFKLILPKVHRQTHLIYRAKGILRANED